MVYLICSKSAATKVRFEDEFAIIFSHDKSPCFLIYFINVLKGLAVGVQIGVATGLAVVVFLVAYFGLVPHVSSQLRDRHSHRAAAAKPPSPLDDSSRSSPLGAMDRSFNPLVSSDADRDRDRNREGKCDHDRDSKKGQQSIDAGVNMVEGDMSDVGFCFRYLLLCVAALESFAHGANDTANSTAAFRWHSVPSCIGAFILCVILCVMS
jgi:hypothetical protein